MLGFYCLFFLPTKLYPILCTLLKPRLCVFACSITAQLDTIREASESKGNWWRPSCRRPEFPKTMLAKCSRHRNLFTSVSLPSQAPWVALGHFLDRPLVDSQPVSVFSLRFSRGLLCDDHPVNQRFPCKAASVYHPANVPPFRLSSVFPGGPSMTCVSGGF